MTLMDLLLQAAKVLELENSDVSADRVTSKSTRGAHFHQYAKSRGENSENSDGSASYGENGAGASEDENPSPQRRITGGKSDLTGSKRQYSRRIKQLIHPFTVAGTREVHNQLEKNRRRQLRECFNHLQQCVPSLENKRVATQSILQGAIKHIKHLKKKDVEQEREIHMLANKKCELKKKYDCELNKCSEEQQRLAEVFLKIIKTEADDCEDNDNLSDSTTTASEGPELSDDEKKVNQPMNSFTLASKVEGSRKRKLGPRATLGYAGRTDNPGVSHSPGVSHVNSKASTVSSSSVALKHMLEQRKKNQQSVATQGKTSWLDKVMQPASSMTKGPFKSVSSLTSSYPMISTHLASGTKPALSTANHLVATASNSQLVTQATVANVSLLGNNLSASTNSNSAKVLPGSMRRKKAHGNNDNTVQQTVLSQNTPLPQTTFKKQYRAPPSSVPSQQSMGPATKFSEANSVDQSLLAPGKTVNVDIQNISYLGKNIIGTNTGGLAMAPISQPLEGSKLLSAVIPVSLASFIRNLPIGAVVPPVVSLAPSQITVAPSTQGSITPVSSSLLTNQLQPAVNPSLLLTNTTSDANQLTTVPLSKNSARIATLLAAPSPHLQKGLLKPNSSLPNSSACQIVTSSSSPTTLGLHDNMKTVTLTQTLLPITLTNGSLANSSNSPGTQLRFFTPFSHNSMMTTSLGNGQTILPTVQLLGASGQVLLQNLIPAQHVSHPHLLGQPIMVMTNPGASYNVTSTGGNTTTVSSPSSVL